MHSKPWRNQSMVMSRPRKPERAGIYPAMIGTLWICSVCVLVAVPIEGQ